MNVKLASQTLSSVIADAIEFVLVSRHPSFLGSEATIQLIRFINNLFDMLNSRSPLGKSFKNPLFLSSQLNWENNFNDCIIYLASLKDINSTPLLKH